MITFAVWQPSKGFYTNPMIGQANLQNITYQHRLSKGRDKARQRKMYLIGRLLDVSMSASSSPPQGAAHPLHVSSTAAIVFFWLPINLFFLITTSGNLLHTRGALGNTSPSAIGPVFSALHGMRPLGFRRAPGLAVTGRSDNAIRPRSSSAHPTVQRIGSKETIPLSELSASADHSHGNEKVQFELFIDE